MMAGGPGRVGLLGRVVGPVQVEVGQDFHWIYCLHTYDAAKTFKFKIFVERCEAIPTEQWASVSVASSMSSTGGELLR